MATILTDPPQRNIHDKYKTATHRTPDTLKGLETEPAVVVNRIVGGLSKPST